MKWFPYFFRGLALGLPLLLSLLVSGCAGSDPAPVTEPTPAGHTVTSADTNAPATPASGLGADYLRPGDRIRIVFNDIPDAPTPTEQVIPEDGKLILPRGVEVFVAGKKRTDVEREIAKIYVDEKRIYRKITITIESMASFVSVGGEVRTPSSIVYRGDMTVLTAIDAAGGFTEYADRSGVIVTRAATKKQIKVNAKRAIKDPQLNIQLYPGDSIHVPRSWY